VNLGHTIAAVIYCPLVKVEAWIQSQDSLVGICDGQSVIGVGLSSSI
jgi:hypothetical protein